MISKAGFECIDFNMQRGFYNVKDNSYNSDFLDIIETHRRRIVECGLKISQTHAPYYYTDYHIKNEIDLKKYLDTVKENNRFCKNHIKWIREKYTIDVEAARDSFRKKYIIDSLDKSYKSYSKYKLTFLKNHLEKVA